MSPDNRGSTVIGVFISLDCEIDEIQPLSLLGNP